MTPEQQGFVALCRELRELGALSVTDGKYTATFAAPPKQRPEPAQAAAPEARAARSPMRKPTQAELDAELAKRRAKELSRV